MTDDLLLLETLTLYLRTSDGAEYFSKVSSSDLWGLLYQISLSRLRVATLLALREADFSLAPLLYLQTSKYSYYVLFDNQVQPSMRHIPLTSMTTFPSCDIKPASRKRLIHLFARSRRS